MAESSSYNSSSPEITPKEEPVTLDKPESPNPFLLADRVEFTFEEIALTTNNEVTLVYPSHSKSDYFEVVSDFISKCCLKEAFTRAPTQYKEYLCEFWYTAKTLMTLRFRFISLLLEYMMPKYDNEELTIHPTQPGARSGLKIKQYSKHTSESNTEASKSKTDQSDKETQSSSAKDKSLSHPLGSTLVVLEMHKEKQLGAGWPASLVATSEKRAYPQLSSDSTAEADPRKSTPNDYIPHPQGMDEGTKNYAPGHIFPGTNPSVLVDQTKFAGDGLKTAHTDLGTNEESRSDEISKKINEKVDTKKDEDTHATSHDVPDETSIPHPPSPKLSQLQELMAQVHLFRSQKDKLEQQKVKAKAKVTSLKARPSYLDINQLTELLVTSLKPGLSKLLASHESASYLLTELKELPSKIIELSEDVKELKKHVRNMEIKLPGDLKEILTKQETFTSTISSLTSQVIELKNIQWELLVEFLDLPSQVSLVQEKLKTFPLPSLLNKVTETLNSLATIVENASRATDKSVASTVLTTASHTKGEKNTNPATKDVETTNLHNELVDLLGIDVMLKRRKNSKIIDCDVLTQKGPITLQVYREDRTIEVISNLKVNDLHLAKWKEVVQACPDRKEKGWKTIYGLIQE
ncbi:hypothetical protein Tco_1304508 [Tanacetum coccineum]